MNGLKNRVLKDYNCIRNKERLRRNRGKFIKITSLTRKKRSILGYGSRGIKFSNKRENFRGIWSGNCKGNIFGELRSLWLCKRRREKWKNNIRLG